MTESAAWHSLPVDDVLRELHAGPEGLSADEAARRLESVGRNELPEEEGESVAIRFLRQFNDVLIYVLLVAAVATGFLGEWIDTGVILAVIFVNAVIGFVQEGKAEAALASIREMLSLEATVRRGGERRTIPAAEVVPGDVVLLEPGDRVPADMRLLSAGNPRIDEAALTGESEPAAKQAEPVDGDAVIGDRASMAYSSTVVAGGRLEGVVVATGEATEIGRIGEMVSGVETLTTPLLQSINRFGRTLSFGILLLGAGLFAFGFFFRDYTLTELLLIVVSLAVAAVPEGLPAIITITLALGVQRMARHNAIIRRLPAVETLGSVTVICSDKTGTLTRNEMTVREIALPGGRTVAVTGTGYSPAGQFERNGEETAPKDDPALLELVRCGFLCSNAEIAEGEDGAWHLDGDPTEGAVVALGMKAGLRREREREAHERLDEIPFASEHRFMATLNHTKESGGRIHLKGAPETVLGLCTSEHGDGEDGSIDPARWRATGDALADQGYRVLALAVGDAQGETLDPDELGGLTLLGLVGIIDPPREEAIKAVRTCHRAGIRVMMITGDHVRTAKSVGAHLGIGDGTKALTGPEMEEMSDSELAEAVNEYDIFARSSPEHKIRLVAALQAHGEVAAMTGDGVNDAPALKRADVGVAMGIKGSEAAKDAAEMVLADDNFATIERAVEEGRTVYDNLKKTILFILPTNGAQALIVLASVIFAIAQLPLTPVQILWINMVTAVTLALALAFERTEAGVMERPPRDTDAPILSGYLLWRIGLVSVVIAALSIFLFFRGLETGMPLEQARTLAANTLIAGQLFYLFSSRFLTQSAVSIQGLLGNRVALLTAGLLILLQMGFTYLPPFHVWFGTAGLAPRHWLWAAGAGFVVFCVVEGEKAVVRRISPG